MQFDQVKEVLGLGDEAELWRERWALSQAAYHDELLWVLDDAGPAELAYMMRLPDEAGEALQAARAALADQPALRRLLWHCHYELVATWPLDYSDVTPARWSGPRRALPAG